jgi:pyruvate dehydrogenase (quinone)
MEECDALLMLRTDFPYREFYPRRAIVLQVDLRGEHIGRRVRVDVPLVGTVKDTATALLPRLEAKTNGGHLDRMREHYANARKTLDELAVNDHNRTPLHPQFVAQDRGRSGRPQCGVRRRCWYPRHLGSALSAYAW